MIAIAGIFTIFLAIHASNSYILLTANLEDVQTLAKQLAASPIAEQISRIWRRASGQANLAGARTPKRVNDVLDEDVQAKSLEAVDAERSSYLAEDRDSIRRSQDAKDLAALGRNASVYLRSIKNIFEKI